MNTSLLYSVNRIRSRIVSLFSLFILTLVSGISYGQLIVNCVPQGATCYGKNDGQIIVTVSGGSTGLYKFSLNNIDWEPVDSTASPYTITGLVAGIYHVYVSYGALVGDQADVEVTQPAELSMTLGGQYWSCDNPPGCSGSITVSIDGGTSPYEVSLDGISGTPPFTVCSGSHTVDLTDAHGCYVPQQNVTIALDNSAPTGCTYPADRFITSFNAKSKYDTLHLITATSPVVYQGMQAHPYDNDTLVYPYDMSGYNDLQFKIAAFQNDVENWENSDFIKVSYSIDDGGSWTDVLDDHCKWQASTDNETGPCTGETNLVENSTWIDLPNGGGMSGFRLRLICYSGSINRSYTVQRLQIRLNSTTAAVTLSESGQPTGCTDNYSTVNITYVDSLLHWYCNTTSNLEFKFQRIWYVADQCGNRERHVQNISVGTIPAFTSGPRDTIFDFCHNASQVLVGPVVSDNCYLRSIAWAATGGASPVSGATNNPTITFTRPVYNDTLYTINWTITDSAGFTNTATQYVWVKKPIRVTISASTADFCSGASVSFTLSATGGTASYLTLTPGDVLGSGVNITPNGTWSDPNNDGTGVFTTSNLTTGSPNIQVIYTDNTISETGGTIGVCSSSTYLFKSGSDYNVHQKISTGAISRTP